LRTPGAVEATTDFGETQCDERDQQPAHDDDDDAVVADEGLDSCGQPEDSGTDRHVDGKGSQRPWADTANQAVVGVERLNR
jgi:hypothetical protein